jgi:hypothetical protein
MRRWTGSWLAHKGPLRQRNEAVAYLAGSSVSGAVARLGLGTDDEGHSVLLACGGADELSGAQFVGASEVLEPAIAAAVNVTGAVVVDGGTSSGVMQITGVRAGQASRRDSCADRYGTR